MIYNSIQELIGRTPVVKLSGLEKGMAEIYVKLESFNPGGSVKDRIALNIIETMEEEGLLKEGDTIVEPTSGNTGIGIAMVSAAKGYNAILTMPETMSLERRKILLAYGAKIVLTEGSKGMKGAIEKAEELVTTNEGYVMLRQFENQNNPKSHEKTTAKEIIEDFKDGLDALVAGVGTGGTITGLSRSLKAQFENLKVVAIEPHDSPVISKGTAGPHKIQGIGAGFVPKTLDTKLLDEIITVKTEEAFEKARMIAKKYGILVGISGGAALFGAFETAKKLGEGKKVLVILPDTGERYLSTELFEA